MTTATSHKPWQPTLLWLAISALALGGCNLVDIEITSPANGAEVVVGEPVTIEVSIAGERAPDVREVAFYQLNGNADAVLLGRDTRAPYQATWTPRAADLGTVVLQAVATDAEGQNLGLTFSEVTVVAAPDNENPRACNSRAAQSGVVGTVAGFGFPEQIVFDPESGIVIGLDRDGLSIADVCDPTRPTLGARTDLGQRETDVAIEGVLAYVVEQAADMRVNLVVLDLSDVSRPTVLSRTVLPGLGAGGVAVNGSLAYVGTGAGLVTVDIAIPRQPRVLGTASPAIRFVRIGVGSGFILAGSVEGLATFDARDPRSPRHVLDTGVPFQSLHISGRISYSKTDASIFVIDWSDLEHPSLIDRYTYVAPDMALVGDQLAFPGNGQPFTGIGAVSILDPYDAFSVQAEIPVDGKLRRLAGSELLVASDFAGVLHVISTGR